MRMSGRKPAKNSRRTGVNAATIGLGTTTSAPTTTGAVRRNARGSVISVPSTAATAVEPWPRLVSKGVQTSA